MLKPRGASTSGAPVTLDTAPAEAWIRLHAPGLARARSPRDPRDGRTVPRELRFPRGGALRSGAQAGRALPELGHRVCLRRRGSPGLHRAAAHSRDARAAAGRQARASRSSCATGARNGATRPTPRSPTRASNAWAPREVPEDQRRGAWVQSVYQVDDSPRYAARGRWEHSDGLSTWISDETWRPLPRREFSVRKDYDVLVGTNRHTITPTGWVQEENNLKLALDDAGSRGSCRIARVRRRALRAHQGLRLHRRARTISSAPSRSGPKCAPPGADRPARQSVHAAAPVDQGQLFVPFFEYAEKLADGEPFVLDDARSFIKRRRCGKATSLPPETREARIKPRERGNRRSETDVKLPTRLPLSGFGCLWRHSDPMRRPQAHGKDRQCDDLCGH